MCYVGTGLLLFGAVLLTGCECGANLRGSDGSDGGDADGSADTDADSGSDTSEPECTEPCESDTRCVAGACVSWGEGEFDDDCTRDEPGGRLRPELQCAWNGPAPDDSLAEASHVLHTPLVVNFHFPGDPDAVDRPAIVFAADSTYNEGGPRGCQAASALRVIDGSSCQERFAITDPADRVNGSVTPAIAELDGVAPPEIVAAAADGGLVAFGFDAAAGKFVRRWHSTEADFMTPSLDGGDTCEWGAVSIHDLDDDGSPEVLFHGAVHDSDGRLIGRWPYVHGTTTGIAPVVADADLDGIPEILESHGTYELVDGAIELDPEWAGPGVAQGYTAVADLGDFPGFPGDAPGRAEIVVSGSNVLTIQTVTGVELWRSQGHFYGGPPTIADFDGDGRPEIGVAFGDEYTVFDLDCRGLPVGCADDGILWLMRSQDLSSARTGSSVFDFNGDGRAEVVYGDECFLRVYDGPTGEVLFSQGRMSSTWTENAIVADVDGDFAAEIVLPASSSCRTEYCGEWDPAFLGLRCEGAHDCPGGECVKTFCRCTDDTQCGTDFACQPETGLCRTRHAGCTPGVRVYRDALDRWASSRAIWNQHAYSVTNVGDDGAIPRSSEWLRNWEQPELNSFRQNVQGPLADVPAADLTVRVANPECGAEAGETLVAVACNRGAAPVDAGVRIDFSAEDGAVLCSVEIEEALAPGQCAEVRCVAQIAEGTVPTAIVDPGATRSECNEDNNEAVGEELSCLL